MARPRRLGGAPPCALPAAPSRHVFCSPTTAISRSGRSIANSATSQFEIPSEFRLRADSLMLSGMGLPRSSARSILRGSGGRAIESVWKYGVEIEIRDGIAPGAFWDDADSTP